MKDSVVQCGSLGVVWSRSPPGCGLGAGGAPLGGEAVPSPSCGRQVAAFGTPKKSTGLAAASPSLSLLSLVRFVLFVLSVSVGPYWMYCLHKRTVGGSLRVAAADRGNLFGLICD